MYKHTIRYLLTLSLIFFQQFSVAESSSPYNFPTDDISIDSKQYHEYNYTGKSYQWIDASYAVRNPQGKWQAPEFDFAPYITSSIIARLNALKLKQLASDSDILITYSMDLNLAAIKIMNFSDTDQQLIFRIPQGALTIIVSDAKTNALLWTGWANADYKNLTPETAKQRLNYAIAEIFKRFPD